MPPKEKDSTITGISLVSLSTANSGTEGDIEGRTTATGISLVNPSNYSGVSGQPTDGSGTIPPHTPDYEFKDPTDTADDDLLITGAIDSLTAPKDEPKLEPHSNTVEKTVDIPTAIDHSQDDEHNQIIAPTAGPNFTDFDEGLKQEQPDDSDHQSTRRSEATGSIAGGYSNSRVSGSKHSSVYGSSLHGIQFGEPQLIRPPASTQTSRRKKVVPLISTSLSQRKQKINLSDIQGTPEENDPTVMQSIDLTDLDDQINNRFQMEAAAGGMPPPPMFKVATVTDTVARKAHRKSVAIKQKDIERGERDAVKKKFFGDQERTEENIKRRRRKEHGKKIMENIIGEISTQTNFTLAVPKIQHHPRLVKPSPSLDALVDYKPTQLELEWNKKLLSHVDWITLGDVDWSSPSAYGRSAKPDPRDTELLKSAIPYDKIESREAWKGKGKVPIFTVRPAYTEIGLRDHTKKSKQQRLEEERREIKERRETKESEQERLERFSRGIRETFAKADQLDEQWLVTLIQAGDAIGLGVSKNSEQIARLNNDKNERNSFKYLRKQILYLTAYCSQEGQKSIDKTLLSVLPGSSRVEVQELILTPELDSKYDSEKLATDWSEAWVDWGTLYAEEMLKAGLTITDRLEKFKNPHREGVLKVLQKIHRQKFVDSAGNRTKSELLHPRDPSVNLVSVKEIVAEEDVIRTERDLVVVHFQTSDPLPVDRLVPENTDFFELQNKEQIEKRASAPDHLYEGSVVLWKTNLGGTITADYLLPAPDPEMENKVKKIDGQPLIDCEWNVEHTDDGHAKAMELDCIQTYDGRLLHQRESTFIFRETQSQVHISYPPRRLVLSLAPGQANEPTSKLRLNDIETTRGRRNHRYLFNWEGDVEKWSSEDKLRNKHKLYRSHMTQFIAKRKAEHAAEKLKRQKVEQEENENEEEATQILENGAEVTENVHPAQEEEVTEPTNPWDDMEEDENPIFKLVRETAESEPPTQTTTNDSEPQVSASLPVESQPVPSEGPQVSASLPVESQPIPSESQPVSVFDESQPVPEASIVSQSTDV
eukprot:TRINITY_DN77_c3_g1_i1.p1 TRINITY_DN77_c3_g1~~TRINITY_DN77_c3_g1_i1.p1  ORF type:complete len:1048 (+),score=263.04 TRINITY_DN77_c3_g1_i1:89-3232(+)